MSTEARTGQDGRAPCRIGGARAAYANLLAAGDIVMPTGGKPLGTDSRGLAGTVLSGPTRRSGPGVCMPVTFVTEYGIVTAQPTFAHAAGAELFRRRLRMRAGPSYGQALTGWAWRCLQDVLDHGMPGAPRPSGEVDGDAQARALEEFVGGQPLDLARILGSPTMYEVAVDCGDGHVWLRVRDAVPERYLLKDPCTPGSPLASAARGPNGISMDLEGGIRGDQRGRLELLLLALGEATGDGTHSSDMARLGI